MSEERVYSDVTEETVVEEATVEDTAVEEPVVTQQPVVAKKGLATASLVLGILAFITTLFFLNYIFGIIALVLGIVYLAKKADVKPKGKAVTGIVLASLSIIISTTLWVSAFVYFTRTNITDIIEDFGALTGQELDGKDVVNQAIKNTIGEVKLGETEINLDTIEAFVGGDVSVEKVVDFVGDVKTEEINQFMDELYYMPAEKVQSMMSEFEGEVTYEKLEEKLGEDFSLEELMDYVRDYQIPTQE